MNAESFIIALRRMLDLHGIPAAMDELLHDGMEANMEHVEKCIFKNAMIHVTALQALATNGEDSGMFYTGMVHMLVILEDAVTTCGDMVLSIKEQPEESDENV